MRKVRGIIYDETGRAYWDEAAMKEIDAELKAFGKETRAKMPDGWPDKDGWLDKPDAVEKLRAAGWPEVGSGGVRSEPLVPRRDDEKIEGNPPPKSTFEAYGGKVDAELGTRFIDSGLTQSQAMAIRLVCLKEAAQYRGGDLPVSEILPIARRFADFVIFGQVEPIEHLDRAPEDDEGNADG